MEDNIIDKNIESYKEQYIYIPEELYNENYNYYFDNEYIRIETNKNCYTQYNSTYCDCYLYNTKENITSEPYACNNNIDNTRIANEKITYDIENNVYIIQDYLLRNGIGLLMIILGIIFALFLTKERSSY